MSLDILNEAVPLPAGKPAPPWRFHVHHPTVDAHELLGKQGDQRLGVEPIVAFRILDEGSQFDNGGPDRRIIEEEARPELDVREPQLWIQQRTVWINVEMQEASQDARIRPASKVLSCRHKSKPSRGSKE